MINLTDVVENYRGKPHQREAIRQLNDMLDPALKRDDSPWVVTWRTPQEEVGPVNPGLMAALTGYPPESFDDVFCDDFNFLLRATGFDQDLTAFRMLMAQMMHETACFKYMKELGTADYFTRMYEGRVEDLGNTFPGDGAKFSGCGAIQCTGRANFQRSYEYMRDHLGVNDPKIMELGTEYTADKYPFLICIGWIVNNNYLDVCKTGDISYATRVLNGGYRGLEDRSHHYETCKRVIEHL